MADTISAASVTHRRVLKIAVPIVLSNATVPLLGIADTYVMGQLGAAAPIGAVGVGAITLTAIYWLFGFLRMGTVGLVAQAEGAGDRAEVVALLMRALIIGLAFGTALVLLQPLVIWGALAIAPASPEVEALARDYMVIRVWSAPAAIAIYGFTGWLIARERTGAVLVLQVWMNGLNIALDLLFVLGLGWGIGGVAFATFIAEWSGLVMAFFLCRRAFRDHLWRDWSRVLDRTRLLAFAGLSRDILIRSFLLEIILVSFLFLGGKFGDVPLAANQILLQFLHLTAYAMDGFAFAGEALVGQARGARNRPALRRAAILTGFWGLMISVALSLMFLLGGPAAIAEMTTAVDVQAEARVYLIYMVLAPLMGCAAWMFDGIFIGATRGADMRNMMIVSVAVYGIAVLTLVPAFGNAGLWAALLISFVARGVTLGLRYPALERGAGAPA